MNLKLCSKKLIFLLIVNRFITSVEVAVHIVLNVFTEFIISGKHVLCSYLCTLLNAIFIFGHFPQSRERDVAPW